MSLAARSRLSATPRGMPSSSANRTPRSPRFRRRVRSCSPPWCSSGRAGRGGARGGGRRPGRPLCFLPRAPRSPGAAGQPLDTPQSPPSSQSPSCPPTPRRPIRAWCLCRRSSSIRHRSPRLSARGRAPLTTASCGSSRSRGRRPGRPPRRPARPPRRPADLRQPPGRARSPAPPWPWRRAGWPSTGPAARRPQPRRRRGLGGWRGPALGGPARSRPRRLRADRPGRALHGPRVCGGTRERGASTVRASSSAGACGPATAGRSTPTRGAIAVRGPLPVPGRRSDCDAPRRLRHPPDPSSVPFAPARFTVATLNYVLFTRTSHERFTFGVAKYRSRAVSGP